MFVVDCGLYVCGCGTCCGALLSIVVVVLCCEYMLCVLLLCDVVMYVYVCVCVDVVADDGVCGCVFDMCVIEWCVDRNAIIIQDCVHVVCCTDECCIDC